jgi:hypothetical protein
MSSDALQRAVQKALDEDAPTDVLFMLLNNCSHGQRGRVTSVLAERAPADARIWLAIAAYRERTDRQAAAVEALLRAYALTSAMKDPAPLRNEFDRVAKKLGLGPLKPATITPELLIESGYQELTAGGPPVTVEVGSDEPALFFIRSPEGECAMFAVRAAPAAEPDGSTGHELAFVEAAGGGRSWGRRGGMLDKGPVTWDVGMSGVRHTTVRMEALAEEGRFRVTAEADEPAAGASSGE